MGGFIATQGHGDAWALAAAEAHVRVHGSDAATVFVGIDGS